MKILLTGNLGYIGTILTPMLLEKKHNVIGYDKGLYKDCLLRKEIEPDLQINKDIRSIDDKDLKGIDAVIHLAGLSNDPLGELKPGLTENINYEACIKLAKLAKKSDVKRFVYASSLSMYGISQTDEELDEYNSEKNPITSYAKTKWQAEQELFEMSDNNFLVVAFRPSTVFGSSPRFRSDIVLNNLFSSAFLYGKINIKSDGSPWRPVVHVEDVSRAFISGLEAPFGLLQNKSFNVGYQNGNYTVRQLADYVKEVLPESEVNFTNEDNKDNRTYKISFERITSELKDYYKPKWDIISGLKDLKTFFEEVDYTDEKFNGKMTNRIAKVKDILEKDKNYFEKI